MGTEYALTLAGDVTPESVAALVAPEAIEVQGLPADERLLSADLDERYGYSVSIYAGVHGYYEAEYDDGSPWIWEPDRYVNVGFRMWKNDPSDRGTTNMVAAVARVLACRTEDAALVLNNNWLLLTRVTGSTHKHFPTWWDNYNVGHLIP